MPDSASASAVREGLAVRKHFGWAERVFSTGLGGLPNLRLPALFLPGRGEPSSLAAGPSPSSVFILGLWRQATRLVPFRFAPRLIRRRRSREESGLEPNEKPTLRKRRRWWLQFSLRGLLVFTVLVAVGLSLWKIYLAPYYRQKPAIDELRRMGIEFHTEPGEGPRWVGWLVGEEDFVRVIRVIDRNRDHHYAGQELERLLKAIDRLPFLEAVSFRGAFTDADLVHLRDKDRLRGVTLKDSQIRGPGLRHLAGVSHLRRVNFSGSASFGDGGLKRLTGHRDLEWLDLGGTQVTDEGLGALRKFPRLRRLRLHDTPISDAGLRHLEGLRKLEFLGLSKTAITGEGLVYLRHIRGFFFLDLSGTRISDRKLGEFKHLPPGTLMDVHDTELTWEAIRTLRPDLRMMPGLWMLEHPKPKPPNGILILPDPAWPEKLDRVRRVAAGASHTRAEPGACESACLIAGATLKSESKTRSTALVRSDHATGPDESGHCGPGNLPL